MNMFLKEIQAERVKYSTPLGLENAWNICNTIAWKHRNEGWGLHRKSGNNWKGYAVDIIAKADGTMIDILIDSENLGVPQWSPTTGVVDWGHPFPIDEVEPPPIDPPPNPPPVEIDYSPVLLQILMELKTQTEILKALGAGMKELPVQVKALFDKGVKIRF
jgi:hypothetical protein